MGRRQRSVEGLVTATAADSFWRDRRVFLTGHTGFKGSWLAAWLRAAGARVTGYALAPEAGRPSHFESARLEQGMDSIIGDLADRALLAASLRAAEPEVVFHLAAQSLVRRSYHSPVETFATNVMGTIHLLEAIRTTPSVRAVVVVTSDKCYENQEWPHAYRESDPLGGRDPYSASKGCAELATASYRASFFPAGSAAVATVRAGNVIGGGDWAEDRIVPDLVRGFTQGQPVSIRAPRAVRPWQHVLEPLRGYLMLAERLMQPPHQGTGAWNFGPPESNTVTVRDLATRIANSWGADATALLDFGTADLELHEAGLLALDWGKAKLRLGWEPVLDLETTVSMTVDWYRAFYRGTDARAITDDQIARYQTAARARRPVFGS